jgi:glutamate-1-semialdehyde aminotransferase
MTGFRLAYGELKSVTGASRSTTLGKVIGGGLPVGAYGGRKEIMDFVAPVGPVYQAGTLSGNPLAVTAGIATLKILRQPGTYEFLESQAKALQQGVVQAANEADIVVTVNRVGSMFTLFFTPRELGGQSGQSSQGLGIAITDWQSAKRSDVERFAGFSERCFGAAFIWLRASLKPASSPWLTVLPTFGKRLKQLRSVCLNEQSRISGHGGVPFRKAAPWDSRGSTI